jgi:glutathione S-transferase
MITVHHLEDSRSQRVLWMLEELGLEYEIRRYARHPVTMLAPPELREVHPLGKSPVLDHDGLVIAESGAILEYLAREAGAMRPDPSSEAGRRCTYWLHYAEGSLMPMLLLRLVFGQLSKPPVPLLARPIAGAVAKGVEKSFIAPRIKEHLGFIEGELDGRTWFAGDEPTVADVQMSFPLEAAASRVGLDRYPLIKAWVARVHARPAYQRALERGGPYAYA